MAAPNAPRNIWEAVTASPVLTARIAELNARNQAIRIRAAAEGQLDDVQSTFEELSQVLITALNGYYELPEQRVVVEYLKPDQRLKIPYVMGTHPQSNVAGETVLDPLLHGRFHRLATLNYQQLYAWARAGDTNAVIRQAVDVIPAPDMTVAPVRWMAENFYVRNGNAVTDDTEVAATFAYVSHALQFNCDVRDYGYIITAGGRLADNAWKDLAGRTKRTFNAQIQPYSLLRIAALNYDACGKDPIAAWTRAYGVSFGLLANLASAHRTEYAYVKGQPLAENTRAISDYENAVQYDLRLLCVNILSMFGLLHLSKDHTFRPSDANMMRISTSYINALRTSIPEDVKDKLLNSMEAICRTAAHPFGLGQTYFCALVASSCNYLAAPLAKRVDVTPPPVQRLMIVIAAADEWTSLPVGRILNEVFASQLTVIRAEADLVYACPPAYSGLHHMYGEVVMKEISAEARSALDAIMPLVYGFAMSQHVDEKNTRDGLALAMSLTNVNRDRASLATSFTTLWDKYMTDMDNDGLVTFAREALVQATGAAPRRT